MEPRIKNVEALTSHGNIAGRKTMVEILEAGLQGADPYNNTRKLIRLERDRLVVGDKEFEPAGDPKSGTEVYDLSKIRNIYVFGAGKGIQRTVKAIEDTLGDRLTGGHVIDKKGYPAICKKVGVTLGGHPVPDEDCARGCQRMLAMSGGLTGDDLVFIVAGNGVSALLTMPVPGVTMDDVRKTTYIMQVERGVPTPELNVIRNHIDRMKSGRISRYMQPAKSIYLAITDPSSYEALMYQNFWLHNLPDCTTFKQALEVLEKWNALDAVPASVQGFILEADPEWETVKAEDFLTFAPWRMYGLMPSASATAFFPSAMKKAEELGFKALFLAEHIWFVETRQAGIMAACIAREIESSGQPVEPPVVLFSGGEMVVSVGDEKGIGGRNQEYALSASQLIAGSDNIVIGSVDTDGTDGPGVQFGEGPEGMPPCLAGGMVDGYTAEEASEAGVNIAEHLKHHDTSPALWKLGSGIHAEPGVSIMDLTAVMIMRKSGKKQSITSSLISTARKR